MHLIMCDRPDRLAERRETVRILVGLARGYEQMAGRDDHGQWLRDEELETATDYQMDAVILANF